MKKAALMIALSVACLGVSFQISTSLRVKIAISEATALNLEQHVADIDSRTADRIANLVATMRAHGPHPNPTWESRRQATIDRLEALLSDWTAAAQEPAAE
jgi:hypothetical protein